MKISFGSIVAILLCLAGAPVHLLVAICIKVSDKGAVLYRSSRLGKDGSTFQMLKYRTMKVDAAPVVIAGFKTIVFQGDPRVTKLGRLLRCGIDELPQLLNIVRGEMAWIGPRPDEAWMLPNYGRMSRQRLSTLPGITGLAQILGSRNLSSGEGYAIDLWYLTHRSFWMDVWIVLATPLFMAGWRSLGKSRLLKLRSTPEFRELCQLCEAELECHNRDICVVPMSSTS